MTKVAFIGLGNMGLPMAENLLESGLIVHAYDLVKDNLIQLEKKGAIIANQVSEVVENANVVITMLPAGEHVRSVYFGESPTSLGILDLAQPNTLLIDSSTIDPESAKSVASKAQSLGLEFVDAPVYGGVAGAKAATLTFIVGGSEKGFEQARQILKCMGKNIFHAGRAGDGQMAKICNNLLLGVLMSGTCEALSLGIDHGLDPKVLSNIMLQSSGRNWALELYNPCPDVMENAPASNDYQAGFMTKLMLKDLGLGMDAAVKSQSPVPMGGLARNLYAFHNANGGEELDFSSLFNFYQK